MTFISIIIGFYGYILFLFLKNLIQDNYDLRSKTLSEKFFVIVDELNYFAFEGRGKVLNIDKRSFSLYEIDTNRLIQFQYKRGHLTIVWKYKCLQKEVVHEKTFRNVRNISTIQQEKMAKDFIREISVVTEKHIENVLAGN